MPLDVLMTDYFLSTLLKLPANHSYIRLDCNGLLERANKLEPYCLNALIKQTDQTVHVSWYQDKIVKKNMIIFGL